MCTTLGTKRSKAWVTAVVLTFTLFVSTALPCFASDYPTPTPSPDPYATVTPTASPTVTPRLNSTSVPAVHVDAAFSFYYYKYIIQSRWSNGAIKADGTLETVSGVNYRTTAALLSVDNVKMIALLNVGNDAWAQLYRVLFYDSNELPLANGYFELPSQTYSFTTIPEGASYVKITIVGGYTGEQAYQRYRVALSPSVERLDDEFWRETVHPISFVSTDSGTTFSLDASALTDELFFDVRYSDSFFTASTVSCSILTEVRNQFYSGAWYPVSYMNEDSADDPVSVWAYFTPYYVNTDGDVVESLYFASTQSHNPFTPSVALSDYKFTGFICNIPLNKPEGYAAGSQIRVVVENFRIDAADVVVDNLVFDSRTKLDRLGDDLAVPQPSFSVDNLLDSALNGVDSAAASSVFALLFGNQLVVHMVLLTLTFALVGYIFFGKRGEE